MKKILKKILIVILVFALTACDSRTDADKDYDTWIKDYLPILEQAHNEWTEGLYSTVEANQEQREREAATEFLEIATLVVSALERIESEALSVERKAGYDHQLLYWNDIIEFAEFMTDRPAITQREAEEKFEAWLEEEVPKAEAAIERWIEVKDSDIDTQTLLEEADEFLEVLSEVMNEFEDIRQNRLPARKRAIADEYMTAYGDWFETADALRDELDASRELNGFSLEDLEKNNVVNTVFAKHSSARKETTYYGYISFTGEPTDVTQTNVMVKTEDGIVNYVFFDDWEYTIEDGEVYFNDDGKHGRYLFFDDGFFEEYYSPYITRHVSYTPIGKAKIISAEPLKIITHNDTRDIEGIESILGEVSGTVESVYELDEDGFIVSVKEYLLEEGEEPRLVTESKLTYSNDDDFPAPEYVRLNKEPQETRTVRFIKFHGTDDEKEFTFIVDKTAQITPLTAERLELFSDPEQTIPHEDIGEDFVVYMG